MWLFLVIMLSLGGDGLDVRMDSFQQRGDCEKSRDVEELNLYKKEEKRQILHITSCFYVPEPKAPPQLR